MMKKKNSENLLGTTEKTNQSFSTEDSFFDPGKSAGNHDTSFGLQDLLTNHPTTNEILDAIGKYMRVWDIKWKREVNKATNDEIWTSQQVMDYLKISERKLQSLRDDGSMPFTKIGNQCRYYKKDIVAFLHKEYNGEK